jgi:hypothetical protein
MAAILTLRKELLRRPSDIAIGARFRSESSIGIMVDAPSEALPRAGRRSGGVYYDELPASAARASWSCVERGICAKENSEEGGSLL